VLFFALLILAALTTAVSLLEVVVAALMERLQWTRDRATTFCWLAITSVGLLSALSSSALLGVQPLGERDVFASLDHLATNWALPIGGVGVAVFVGWVLSRTDTFQEYTSGGATPGGYSVWLALLRVVIPVALSLVLLQGIGVL
jgi:NSS family neurotransmitter:Na+ symporter